MRRLVLTLMLASSAAAAQPAGTLPAIPPGAQVERVMQPPAPMPATMPDYQLTSYKLSRAVKESDHAVLATCTESKVEKDARGLLWTTYRFSVNETIKGGFTDNAFSLRVVGGAHETPQLKEYVVTGGLDLGFAPGRRYVMLLRNTGEGTSVAATRQEVWIVEEGSTPAIAELNGAKAVIKKDNGSVYAQGEPVLLADFIALLKSIRR